MCAKKGLSFSRLVGATTLSNFLSGLEIREIDCVKTDNILIYLINLVVSPVG